MTLEGLAETVPRLSYKPGTTFTLFTHEDPYRIEVLMRVVDSRDHSKTMEWGRAVKIDANELPDISLPKLLDRIYRHVEKMEEHETQEFLLCAGVPIRDGHPEEKRS